MAYKTFVNGFPLNASELNTFLMNQSVATFADAAARTAAIATPAEGQLTYLNSDDSYYKYDGAAWVKLTGMSSDLVPTSPNYIINGAFDIWQRGTTFSNPTNGSFAADRLYLGVGGTPTDVTVSRQTFTPGDIESFGFGDAQFYTRLSIADKGSMTTFNFRQYIEGVRTLAGQTVTFSFWAKADSARQVRVDLKQNFGSGGSAEVNHGGTNQALSTTWTRYSFSYNLGGLSGKTIGAGDKLYFVFELEELDGATYDIWGLQLEAGSVATPFRRNANSIQGELAACQRYFQRISATAANTYFGSGTCDQTTRAKAFMPLVTQMRTNPSVSVSAVGDFQVQTTSAFTVTGFTTFGSSNSVDRLSADWTVASGLTLGHGALIKANNTTNAYIDASAEL